MKSKEDRQHNDQHKKDKMTNNDHKTPHRKLKIEKHEPHYKPGGVNLGAPEGYAVPAPLVVPVVLLSAFDN